MSSSTRRPTERKIHLDQQIRPYFKQRRIITDDDDDTLIYFYLKGLKNDEIDLLQRMLKFDVQIKTWAHRGVQFNTNKDYTIITVNFYYADPSNKDNGEIIETTFPHERDGTWLEIYLTLPKQEVIDILLFLISIRSPLATNYEKLKYINS